MGTEQKSMFRLFSAIFLLLFACSPAFAEKQKMTDLQHGWQEYGFQEFSKSLKFFDQVIKMPRSKEDLCQALTGRAFCFQFGQGNRVGAGDYREAINCYERCLEELGREYHLVPFWKAMIAECHFRLAMLASGPEREKEMAAAQEIWDFLESEHHDSIYTHEAILLRACVQTRDFSNMDITQQQIEKIESVLAPVVEKLPEQSGNSILAPVMAHYLAEVYFWRKQYAESVKWYVVYCELGPTSVRDRTAAWFKIARIADLKLDDKATAIEYYTKIWKEASTDRKAYFCSQRAKELIQEQN